MSLNKTICIEVATQKSRLQSRQAMKQLKGNRRRTDMMAVVLRGGMENIHITPSLKKRRYYL